MEARQALRDAARDPTFDWSDYTGELEGRLTFELTDKASEPVPTVATTQPFPISFAVPCAATADTVVGATCDVATDVNALIPGALADGLRAILETAPVEISRRADWTPTQALATRSSCGRASTCHSASSRVADHHHHVFPPAAGRTRSPSVSQAAHLNSCPELRSQGV